MSCWLAYTRDEVPSYWQECRPYRIHDSRIKLTDQEILREYGPNLLALVLKGEAAWKRRWGRLTRAEAARQNADECNAAFGRKIEP
jgi:hypothetical protein